MAMHKRSDVLSFVLLVCIPIHHFSGAYSHIRNIVMPMHNIGKATLQSKLEKDEKLDPGIKERNRRLKSGKHVKVSKESKKKGSSYYDSSHYTNSYPFYQMPVSSPTCKLYIEYRKRRYCGERL